MLKKFPYVKPFFSIGLIQVVAIFIICLMPVDQLELPTFNGLDKIEHFLAYLFLSFYFCQVLVNRLYSRTTFLFVVMGILIECLQNLTGYRMFDLWDILANTLGVLLGGYLGGKYGGMLQNLCFKFSQSDVY